jgi:hypothetical protein
LFCRGGELLSGMAAAEGEEPTPAAQAPQAGHAQQGRGEVLVKEEFRLSRWELVSQVDGPEAAATADDKPASKAPAGAVDTEEGEDGSSAGRCGEGGKKERKRGQNKKRPRNTVEAADQFCRAMTLHGDCRYQDKCKFMHDAVEFLKRKDKVCCWQWLACVAIEGLRSKMLLLQKFSSTTVVVGGVEGAAADTWDDQRLVLFPQDLGPECPMYKRFGQCPAGITCRWASCHITPEGLSVKRGAEEGGVVDIPAEMNQLPTTVIMQLQKRK